MTAQKGAVTLICDNCKAKAAFGLTTVGPTRAKARRFGWRVSMRAVDEAGPSTDPRRPDWCKTCADTARGVES